MPSGRLAGGAVMETLGYLMEGFAVALTLNNLMYALFGAFVGTLIGCLPGLGGITGKNPMKTVIAAALGIMISTVGIDISTGTQLRGGILGFISGVLPGAGASLGSFISYTLEKQVIGKKGKFGEGDIRGVVAPEAGNNGASSGAMVPMLTLGVPGSGTTAVLLAMLISLNITPGPLMFTQNADIVWGLIAALLIGNLLLLVLNIPLVGFFVKLLSVPPMYLLPIVTMVAFVGIYSISHSAFDLYFMVAFGVAGYFLRKLEIPLVPIILGLLLGPEMEKNLAHAMVLSDGEWSILWGSPLAMGLWVFAGLGLALPYLVGPILRRRMRAAIKETPVSD